jgi:hypothetical protein
MGASCLTAAISFCFRCPKCQMTPCWANFDITSLPVTPMPHSHAAGLLLSPSEDRGPVRRPSDLRLAYYSKLRAAVPPFPQRRRQNPASDASSKSLSSTAAAEYPCPLKCIAQTGRPSHGVTADIMAPKLNSVAWVCERATPTERPPIVDEVTANSLWMEGRGGSPTSVISIS